MIDYVKFMVRNKNTSELIRAKAKFKYDFSPVDESSGELIHNSVYTYCGLTIKVCPSGLNVFEGSLHKYKNNGCHNHDQFSYNDIKNVLLSIQDVFQFSLGDAKICNIEIGANLHTDSDPIDFIDKCVVLLAGRPVRKSPITKNDSTGFSKGIRFELSEYELKIYSKSRQFNLSRHTLRVEYKTRRQRSIENTGIVTLVDLLDINKLIKLSDHLQNVFDHLLINEDIEESRLSHNQKINYQKAVNGDHWCTCGSKQRLRLKGYHNAIVGKYGLSNHKETIAALIKEKIKTLLTGKSVHISQKNLKKSVHVLQENHLKSVHILQEPNTPSATTAKSAKCPHCHPLDNSGKSGQPLIEKVVKKPSRLPLTPHERYLKKKAYRLSRKNNSQS